MSELNLDKCLEAAIEVAKQAGKVKKRKQGIIPLEHDQTNLHFVEALHYI